MSPTTTKSEASAQFEETNSEFETRNTRVQKNGSTRALESVRLGLTLLGLLAGITIVGTAADTLMVYNTTTLAGEFTISVWPTPSEFDLRPTIALVTCGSIVLLASAVSIGLSKLQSIRNRPLLHHSAAFLTPAICLIAGLVGVSFFYGVNRSNTVYSLQAWTCQWSSVNMSVKPHWGTLCKESKVALYLMVMIIPLEILVLSSTVFETLTEKKIFVARDRKGSGSPAMS